MSKLKNMITDLLDRMKGEHAHHRPARFIMLMPGRTGSSYIIERMDSHPNIIAKGEIFGGGDVTEDISRVRRKLTSLYKKRYPGEILATGYKTKLYGNTSPVYADVPLFKKVISSEIGIDKCIILLRHNVVKQAVSRLRTEALKKEMTQNNGSDKWNIRQEQDKVAKCRLPPADIDTWIRKYEKENNEIRAFGESLGVDTLVLYYEDLMLDPDSLMLSIFGFLDVPKVQTASTLIKHTNDDLSTMIENFDELLENYRGTPYEEMFLSGAR